MSPTDEIYNYYCLFDLTRVLNPSTEDMDRSPGLSVSDAHEADQPHLRARRHQSVPARSTQAEGSPPPFMDPTSPEMINSLISSLSAISIPFQNYFDNGPAAAEPGSELHSTEIVDSGYYSIDRPHHIHGGGVSEDTPGSPDDTSEGQFLRPDDAAASPVVRMARSPPSPKSPPKSLTSQRRLSQTAKEEDLTTGTINAEQGARHSTTASVASSSSGRMSLKGPLGLLRRNSRDVSPEKQQQLADRFRNRNSYNDGLGINVPNVPRTASLRSMRSVTDIGEEKLRPKSILVEPPKEGATGPSPISTPGQMSPVEQRYNMPIGIATGKAIPNRDSSLRHSHTHTGNAKKRRSRGHSRQPSKDNNAEPQFDKAILEDGKQAEQVTRRIQEIKEHRQRIRSEYEPSSPPPPPARENATALSNRRAHSRVRSEIIDWEPLLENSENQNNSANEDEQPVPDDSAPSPAVMTVKSSNSKSPMNGDSRFARNQSPSEKRSRSTGRLERSSSMAARRNRRAAPNSIPASGASNAEERRPSTADPVKVAISDRLSSLRLTQKVAHPATGRIIAFSEVGDPKGYAVLCCLGMGVTRYLMAFYDELARSLHLRLITLDRPGVGESGPFVDEVGTPLTWPGK